MMAALNYRILHTLVLFAIKIKEAISALFYQEAQGLSDFITPAVTNGINILKSKTE